MDGIPSEVWKHEGGAVKRWLWGFCSRVWMGQGWPESWKEGEIVPVVKKGEGDTVEEYRGITLMPSAYKVYATVLAERLREEVERGRVIPQSQAGSRKGMGTIDNIYVLNYLINRQIHMKGGRLVALFVDLKVAFDSVDREVLVGMLRGRGISDGVTERVVELLRETKSRVRVGKEVGGTFWTARGVRQGCPLSPLLFNIMLADVEEELGKVKWGGVKLGEGKVYTLAYADDMVLLAENEDEMSMLERLEEYLGKKNLELNTKKTKILRFRKGGGRVERREWRWKGKKYRR